MAVRVRPSARSEIRSGGPRTSRGGERRLGRPQARRAYLPRQHGRSPVAEMLDEQHARRLPRRCPRPSHLAVSSVIGLARIVESAILYVTTWRSSSSVQPVSSYGGGSSALYFWTASSVRTVACTAGRAGRSSRRAARGEGSGVRCPGSRVRWWNRPARCLRRPALPDSLMLEVFLRDVHLASVRTEQIHQIRRFRRSPLLARNHERVRRRRLPLSHHPLGLRQVVVEEGALVVGDVLERDHHARLLIVDVAAHAPLHAVHRRIGRSHRRSVCVAGSFTV